MSSSFSEKLKANYWLQMYTSDSTERGIVVEDFFNKRRFLFEDSTFLHVLGFCNVFKSHKSIMEFLKKEHKLNFKDIKDILGELTKKDLLITKDSPAYLSEKKAKMWKRYGWDDALNYFISIKDYPFLDYESIEAKDVDNELMYRYIKTDPVPSIYKEYKNSKRIFLKRDFSSLNNIDLRTLLIEKVFDNQSNEDPLTNAQISNILFNTFGEMGRVEFPLQGEFVLKTSPSGGARHPIEAYLISFNTELPRGIYHYSVKNNCLEEISLKLDEKELNEIIYELNTGPQFSIKAIVVFSALFPRSMWRYREPRSYRVVFHDLGHLLETMKIVSKAFNVKTYFGHGFYDSKLAKLLNISGQEEAVLKFAALS